MNRRVTCENAGVGARLPCISAGAVLICMTPPQPDTYEAARRAGAATPGPEGDVAVVQVLTVAEVSNGRRPEGRAA